MLIGGVCAALGMVALLVAALLIRGVEQCDALGVGCGRVHAYDGLAAAGWALMFIALLALVIAGVRRLRRRSTHAMKVPLH